MLASFNPFMTTEPAQTKQPFFATEDIPIPDDQQDVPFSFSTDSIEKAMQYMDKKHNSRFHAWIRNEANLCHTCNHMHPIVAEFENNSPHVMHRAVKWLTAGWSVPGTAELIIKLFFHWGIGSAKFSNLVSEVTRTWAIQPYVVDLVGTLVVAEDVEQVARFIKHFTEGWEVQSVVNLVATIASTLKWGSRYYKNFILNYVALERRHRRMTVESIRQRFELRKQRLRNFKLDARGAVSGNEFCSTIFELCVLEVHEIRYLQKLESARQALDNTTIVSEEGEEGTLCSDSKDKEGRLPATLFSLSMSCFLDDATPDASPDTPKAPTLTASSSSSTLVGESAPSILPTSTSWDSLASLESVDEIIASSQLLLEEHRIETIRQAALLKFFERCALSSEGSPLMQNAVGTADLDTLGHHVSSAFEKNRQGEADILDIE